MSLFFCRGGSVIFSCFPPRGRRCFLSLFRRGDRCRFSSPLHATSLVFLTTSGEGRWGELSNSEEDEGEEEKEEDELEGKDGMGDHPPVLCIAGCNQKLLRFGCSHCSWWTDATIFALLVPSQTGDGDYTDAEVPSDREGEGESEDEEAGRVVWEADEMIPRESDADENESEPEPDEEEQAWFTPQGYKVYGRFLGYCTRSNSAAGCLFFPILILLWRRCRSWRRSRTSSEATSCLLAHRSSTGGGLKAGCRARCWAAPTCGTRLTGWSSQTGRHTIWSSTTLPMPLELTSHPRVLAFGAVWRQPGLPSASKSVQGR